MAEPGLDDVFGDDITVPATDGYPLAATLFLPRGAKRHAVLINSATAVPRKLHRGFAGYLAKRCCASLTYDYRGTGESYGSFATRAGTRSRGRAIGPACEPLLHHCRYERSTGRRVFVR